MIENAQIESTTLGYEHGIFTGQLQLAYRDNSVQSFGGYNLSGAVFGIKFITGILMALDVGSWEELPGTYCRIDGSDGRIKCIGHIMKDQWFDPEKIK